MLIIDGYGQPYNMGDILKHKRLQPIHPSTGSQKLKTSPDFLLCDGDIVVPISMPQQSIVEGDQRSLSIAAASILAKVTRDRLIVNLDVRYPGYDLKNNMGYGTRKHREALKRLGPTPLHRTSFRGVCSLGSMDSNAGDNNNYSEERLNNCKNR